ncbi:RNA methyltransferase tRNA(m5U54)methyltransferase, partial [Elasticomyces elasticus]
MSTSDTNPTSAALEDTPREGRKVIHDGTEYTTVKEGLAYILVPPNARTATDPKTANEQFETDAEEEKRTPDAPSEQQSVFYNPVQQFNRDLSVLAIRAFCADLCERKREKQRRQKAQDTKRKEKRKGKGDDVGGRDGETKRRRVGEDGGTDAAQSEEAVAPGAPEAAAGEAEAPRSEDVSITVEDDSAARHSETLVSDSAMIPPASNHGKTTQPPEDVEQARQPWQPKFRILDALSATGLRALRYAQEIPFATSITANDLSPSATASIALNIQHNKLTNKITTSTANALAHMYGAAFATPAGDKNAYDVIDLDPYGTAAPFLDAAVQAINDGGLLCVTCTDAGVFASCGYSEKTYSLYGGLPIKGHHSHEGGLRLILHAIATSAARYGIAIEPLLSLSIDYYVRVFVRVKRSPAEVKFLAGKTMTVYQCDGGCGAWSTQLLARNVEQKGKKDTVFFKHVAAQG